MRIPPPVDTADEARELPYPIETLRHWYVSPFGGRSEELDDDEVGVNHEALAQNTDLAAEDPVAVAVSGTDPDRPWFFQEEFHVVPLDERKPEAASLSPIGEVVLPEREWDFVRRPDLQPKLGEAVVLKGVERTLDGHPDWLAELLAKKLKRPDL